MTCSCSDRIDGELQDVPYHVLEKVGTSFSVVYQVKTAETCRDNYLLRATVLRGQSLCNTNITCCAFNASWRTTYCSAVSVFTAQPCDMAAGELGYSLQPGMIDKCPAELHTQGCRKG